MPDQLRIEVILDRPSDAEISHKPPRRRTVEGVSHSFGIQN